MTTFSSASATTNTYSSIQSSLKVWLLGQLVSTLERELQFQKFTIKAQIPAGQGKIAVFNFMSNVSGSTTALQEGTTTDNETAMTSNSATATIQEFGEFFPVSSLLEVAAIPAVRDELVKRMQYGALLSLDSQIRNAAVATTQQWWCGTNAQGGSTTQAQPTSLGASAIVNAAAVTLRKNGVRGFTGVPGHITGEYAAIIAPTAEGDLVSEMTTLRISWAQAVTNVPGVYAQDAWAFGYMGSLYGVACYRTQNYTTASVTSTATLNYLLGDGGLGSVSLTDAQPQVYINTPSQYDVGNPYRNRSTISWHAYFAASLIDATRVVKIYASGT